MEDTLGELKIKDYVESLQSLNPYSNGRYSRSIPTRNKPIGGLWVLILILMEDTLGEQK